MCFYLKLRTNSSYFPVLVQHYTTDIYDRDEVFLLQGMTWIFKYIGIYICSIATTCLYRLRRPRSWL
jgi:hypothetical protein